MSSLIAPSMIKHGRFLPVGLANLLCKYSSRLLSLQDNPNRITSPTSAAFFCFLIHYGGVIQRRARTSANINSENSQTHQPTPFRGNSVTDVQEA